MAIEMNNMTDSMKQINGIAQSSAEGTQNISAATEEQLASMEEITASTFTLSKWQKNYKIKQICSKYDVYDLFEILRQR